MPIRTEQTPTQTRLFLTAVPTATSLGDLAFCDTAYDWLGADAADLAARPLRLDRTKSIRNLGLA
jgi:hypothetical protein